METDLKAHLKKLGLKQSELARLLDVTPRAVSQWATGDTAVPGPVRGYLRLFSGLNKKQRDTEISVLENRANALDEGIYELMYSRPKRDQDPHETALCVLRNGKVVGSDRWGGIFEGTYKFDNVRRTNSIHVRLQVPPGGELITGFVAGPEGADLDIQGFIGRAQPTAKTTVEISGQHVQLNLKFVGPLPV